MPTVLVKCPYCGTMMEVDSDETIGFCEKCQDDFLIKQAMTEDVDDLTEIEENYEEDESGNLVAKIDKLFTVTVDGELIKYKGIDETIIVPEGIKKIAKYVFSGMEELKSITLPKSLEVIGECAFEGCTGIEKVIIPANVKVIDNDAFDSCTSLNTVKFASGSKLEVIGESAFVRCNHIVNFTVPKSVLKIKSNAFSECRKLWQFNFETDARVEEIRENAFSKCENIINFVVPRSVKKIGKNIFFGCRMLKYLSFENESMLEEIEKMTFNNCPQLEQIILPSSLKVIGEQAFKGCPNLVDIRIEEPAELKVISKGAFQDCSALRSLNIPIGVVEISENAFMGCTNLNTIGISRYVETIGPNAFCSCKNLENIIIEQNSHLKTIGEHAFENCESIEFIKLNDTVIDSIGQYAFSKCDKMLDFLVPKDVTVLQNDTFRGCKNLKNISFLNNGKLNRICENAFYWCSSLTNISLPHTLEVIEGHAFEGCVGIETIRVPSSVKEIGQHGVCGADIYMDFTNPASDPNSIVGTWVKDWFDNYRTKIHFRAIKPIVTEPTASSEVVKPSVTPVNKPVTPPTQTAPKINMGTNNWDNLPKKKGCYIASCVYGSYNTSEVFVLRRYRDFYLDKHVWGKLFIKCYYFISPKLVSMFGKTRLFNKMFKRILDRKVKKLESKGYENTPYND